MELVDIIRKLEKKDQEIIFKSLEPLFIKDYCSADDYDDLNYELETAQDDIRDLEKEIENLTYDNEHLENQLHVGTLYDQTKMELMEKIWNKFTLEELQQMFKNEKWIR